MPRRDTSAELRPVLRQRIGVGSRHHRVWEAVQPLAARLRPRVNEALEVDPRPSIRLALVFDYGLERHPVFLPAPCIEFGAIARAERDIVIATDEPKQVPDLLLPAVAPAPLALHPVLRHLVTQPVARAAQD